jgi:hypothetical protein
MPTNTIDFIAFIAANIVNITMVILFICRTKKLEKAEYFLGLIVVAMILPLAYIVIVNFLQNREWPFYILPISLILFLLVELYLDYIKKIDFRNSTLIWPYIVLYYLGLMGMIGYTFLANKTFGFITLGTYFINLFATWYAHK